MDKVSMAVGLIGGSLGIIAAIGGAVAVIIAYFATQDQLKVVDCYQYYGSESLSAQTDQIQLVPKYKGLVEEAADAQIKYGNDKTNATVLADYKKAVNDQNEAYKQLNEAQTRSLKALEEQKKCGHKGPEQLQ